MTDSSIHDYLVPGRRAHLVGIGGVSMAPLAEVLHGMGMTITGSDMRESPAVDHLRALGIPIAIGQRAENVAGAELVIRTAAAHDSNPEIAEARRLGLPVYERAQAWGSIMRAYRNALCIAGTHGKTTTTSMCTHIAMAAAADPTVMIGGTLPLLGAGHRVGHGDTIILESCEYCNSFLHFYPTIAVILNVEADHLDFFQDLEDVERSFRAFADRVPEDGLIIANRDDEHLESPGGSHLPHLRHGRRKPRPRHEFSEDWREFDVICDGKPYAHISLSVAGRHNAMNALAACSAAYFAGIPGDAAARALHHFTGAGRRWSSRAATTAPTSTMTTPTTPESSTPSSPPPNPWATGGFSAPSSPTPTPAPRRSSPTLSGSSKPWTFPSSPTFSPPGEQHRGRLLQDARRRHPRAVYCPSLPEVTAYLREHAQEGDLILTVGAGDIYKAGDALLQGK